MGGISGGGELCRHLCDGQWAGCNLGGFLDNIGVILGNFLKRGFLNGCMSERTS